MCEMSCNLVVTRALLNISGPEFDSRGSEQRYAFGVDDVLVDSETQFCRSQEFAGLIFEDAHRDRICIYRDERTCIVNG